MSLISDYLTDKINIIKYSVDEWNKSHRSALNDIPAHIEDKNKLIRNSNGQEVVGLSYIIIEKSNQISYIDKIQLVEKNNEEYENKDQEFLIKNIERPSGFDIDPGYIGVWI